MQKEKTPPKKPLTAFFLFKEKMKAEGKPLSAKEAGAQWKALDDAARKVYLDSYKKAKAEFDKYLEEVEGIKPKSSEDKKKHGYSAARIRAVLCSKKEIKSVDPSILRALSKAIVTNTQR